MKLVDILEPIQLDETAVRTFKRLGNTIRRYFRCKSGARAGTYASSPAGCNTRKDPGKVRHGKKVARHSKAIRVRKTRITKRRGLARVMKHHNNKASYKPVAKKIAKPAKVNHPNNPSTIKAKKPKSPK